MSVKEGYELSETETSEGSRASRIYRSRARPMVLLVDDDLDARAMYRFYLKRMGCRVITARDGLAALDKAVKFIPDVIVMDLLMPRMDGWEAAARLKRQRTTSHIPVIAVSAVQTSRDRARAAGCDAFLAKPCSPELLWLEVRVLLDTPPGEKP